MSVRQLSTSRPGRKLRWTHGGGLSIRAYLSDENPELCPCVSTHGAELTVVLEGEIAIEVGPLRQARRVLAGEAIWIPRGIAHAVIVGSDARAFIVDETAFAEEPGLRHVPSGRMPAGVLRAFANAWSRRPDRALARVDAARRDLLACVMARDPMVVEARSSTSKMMLAKRVLEERFTHPPSLGELARIVGTSEFYLLRSFKQHFTFTPYAYAQFLRTEKFFWELLTSRDRLLTDLAADAGFGDYSTFHRRMRAMTGKAPSGLMAPSAERALGPT